MTTLPLSLSLVNWTKTFRHMFFFESKGNKQALLFSCIVLIRHLAASSFMLHASESEQCWGTLCRTMLNYSLPQVVPLLEKKNCVSRIKPSIQQQKHNSNKDIWYLTDKLYSNKTTNFCWLLYVNERYLEMQVQRQWLTRDKNSVNIQSIL